ncbi:MAG: hypothetical protein JNL60_08035, partial [Bacteroidia bacterium]|nr:hypothetical protein [Bacteroidia bacterium]
PSETDPDSYREDPMYLEHAEPSAKTIQNILNYSRNLEVQNSKLVKQVEYTKS